MTLKEFADTHIIRAECFDIAIWDEQKEDRNIVMSFEDDVHDLAAILRAVKFGTPEHDFLYYKVHSVDIYASAEGAVCQIEIVQDDSTHTLPINRADIVKTD